MPAWDDYQNEVSSLFVELGMHSETNVRLRGVRTSHDVDVVVRSTHVGFDMLWVVECKRYKSRVSKLHVLALRQIVSELGADRGILMAENGFQRGAKEAASLTNVQLSSIAALRESHGETLAYAKLRALQDRLEACGERYWSLSKAVRIAHDLRPDVGAAFGYRARLVLQTSAVAINDAFRSGFPVVYDTNNASWPGVGFRVPVAQDAEYFNTPRELQQSLALKLDDLERRLLLAETASSLKDTDGDPPLSK